jgi:predicted aldo/keto reductase-like oxidoreductase
MLPSTEYVFDHFETGFGADMFKGVDPERTAFYKLCTQKQVGITVMKTLGAGKLISKEHTPFAEPLTVGQCVHYALSRPAVASVLLGCQTGEQVKNAMEYFDLSDGDKDYSGVLGSMRNDFKGNCVYCGHCQPCPVNIDIAAVNKYLDIARLDTNNIAPTVKAHYNELEAHAEACVKCGSCEKRCPFGVPIIDNMSEAAWLLK